MGFFELQIRAPVLLQALTATFQSRRNCLSSPLDVGGVSITVHQVEVRESTVRHDKPRRFPVFYIEHGVTYGLMVSGYQTQIAQKVGLHFSTTDDVLAHAGEAPGSLVVLEATVVLDLDYALTAEPIPKLLMTLSSVEWPDELPWMPPSVDAATIKAKAKALFQEVIKFEQQSLDITTLSHR